jgi:hypothetical protein
MLFSSHERRAQRKFFYWRGPHQARSSYERDRVSTTSVRSLKDGICEILHLDE